MGLFVSAGIVLLKILLRQGIESPEQLEELGINVYASIPVSESLSKLEQRKGIRKIKIAASGVVFGSGESC